jgi:hypothetical protein
MHIKLLLNRKQLVAFYFRLYSVLPLFNGVWRNTSTASANCTHTRASIRITLDVRLGFRVV